MAYRFITMFSLKKNEKKYAIGLNLWIRLRRILHRKLFLCLYSKKSDKISYNYPEKYIDVPIT